MEVIREERKTWPPANDDEAKERITRGVHRTTKDALHGIYDMFRAQGMSIEDAVMATFDRWGAIIDGNVQ